MIKTKWMNGMLTVALIATMIPNSMNVLAEEAAKELRTETVAEVMGKELIGKITLVDKEATNGAEVYVYVPNEIGYVYTTDVVPIVMVYGKFDAAQVEDMIKGTDLQEYAHSENAVVTFVNPIGDTWDSETDVEAYRQIINNVFVERPDEFNEDGKGGAFSFATFSTVYGYAGAKTRISIIAEGETADFVSKYLVTDNFLGYSGNSSWARGASGLMLFNPTVVPTAAADQYPAIIINGTEDVVKSYEALNANDPTDFATLTSEVSDGFDFTLINRENINQMISNGRVQTSGDGGSAAGDYNAMIYNMPIYSEIGIEVTEGTYVSSAVEDADMTFTYEVYMPKELENAEEGSVPLLLNFPGWGLSSYYQVVFSGWAEYAAEAGFITIGVNQYEGDSAYFADLIDHLLAEYPQLDASRVYAAGFSMGSIMCGQLALEIPEKLAAVAPNAVLRAPNDELVEEIKIPVYYVGGHYDANTSGHSVFPTDETVEDNIVESNAFWNQIFSMNDIGDGSYDYDETAENTWWGISEFDDVQILKASEGAGEYRINSLKSNDGVVYTKLVDVSHWGHEYYPELCEDMWNFMTQFSRNEDGTLNITVK